MSMVARLLKTSVSFVLIAALALAGCSRAGVVPAPADAASLALAVPAANDKAAMLKYLQTAQEDFAIVDTLLADQDLGLLEEPDSSSSEDLTADEVTQYLTKLTDYTTQVKDTMDAIGTRLTPNNPDIAFFTAAELSELQLSSDILGEYTQVLNYYNMMLDVNNGLDKVGDVNTKDLEGTYKSYNDAITKAIDTLKNGDIPSCLKSMNDNFIAALSDMNDAVLYTLNAYSLSDPLRTASAAYRLGMLTRRVQMIGKGLQDDLIERQKKLLEDAKGIQKTNEGLKKWVQDNIDRLN